MSLGAPTARRDGARPGGAGLGALRRGRQYCDRRRHPRPRPARSLARAPRSARHPGRRLSSPRATRPSRPCARSLGAFPFPSESNAMHRTRRLRASKVPASDSRGSRVSDRIRRAFKLPQAPQVHARRKVLRRDHPRRGLRRDKHGQQSPLPPARDAPRADRRQRDHERAQLARPHRPSPAAAARPGRPRRTSSRSRSTITSAGSPRTPSRSRTCAPASRPTSAASS